MVLKRLAAAAALAAALSLAAPPRAWPHPIPFSYVDLVLGAQGIECRVTVHAIDLAHDLGVAAPGTLLEALGGRRVTIREDEFDNHFVIVPGTGTMTRIRY